MASLAPFARRFHFPMRVNQASGRIAEEAHYDDYIRQLIRQVLLTAKGERINRPNFGAGVRRLVFAPLSDATAMLARTMIYEALTQWLTAVIKVESIEARANQSTLSITITYRVIAHGERRYLNEEIVLP